MGDGTKEKPYTREDVRRLIEEHGGTAEGLDLSGKTFEDAIDLRGLNLTGIILKNAIFWDTTLEAPYTDEHMAGLEGAHFEGALLMSAHLEEADLSFASLEGADVKFTHLEGAVLTGAHLEGANLMYTNMKGVFLGDVTFSPQTRLEQTFWGNFYLSEEEPDYFDTAVDTYRRLKQWYTNAGMYNIAGEFFFREMTVKRKQMAWWPNPLPRTWSKFLSLICGYGERPLRVIGWAASVILVSTLIYFLFGSVWEWWAFWKSLYFSAVSFTALGYGNWLEISNDWIRGLGAFESFIGVFSIALFLITFVRKMIR